MSRSVLVVLPFLCALLAAPASLAQQTFYVEVSPFVGWRSGGSLAESTTGGVYSIEGSSSYGAVADVSLGSPGLFAEIAWTRQETRVSYRDAFGPGLDALTLDTFLVGGQWDAAPRALFRPFLSAGVGVTRLEAPGSAATVFTGALSGGVKVMPLANFGIRLEARGLALFGGGRTDAFCNPSGCTVGFTGGGIFQGEVTAGLVVAF